MTLNPTAKSFNVLLYEYELQRHNLIFPQGQSRHMHVEVRPVPDSGTLPLIALSVLSLSIGDIRVQQVCPAKGGESRRVRKKISLVGMILAQDESGRECWNKTSTTFLFFLFGFAGW